MGIPGGPEDLAQPHVVERIFRSDIDCSPRQSNGVVVILFLSTQGRLHAPPFQRKSSLVVCLFEEVVGFGVALLIPQKLDGTPQRVRIAISQIQGLLVVFQSALRISLYLIDSCQRTVRQSPKTTLVDYFPEKTPRLAKAGFIARAR